MSLSLMFLQLFLAIYILPLCLILVIGFLLKKEEKHTSNLVVVVPKSVDSEIEFMEKRKKNY